MYVRKLQLTARAESFGVCRKVAVRVPRPLQVIERLVFRYVRERGVCDDTVLHDEWHLVSKIVEKECYKWT